MEIINNSLKSGTAFGMAIKKPSPEIMGEFTDYLTNGGKKNPNTVARGLKKIVQKHANDKYLDLVFEAPKTWSVVAKTEDIEKMIKNGELTANLEPNGIAERYNAKYGSEAYKTTFNKATGAKKVWMIVKQLASVLKKRIVTNLYPEESLPKNLRKASINLTAMESKIDAKIAKEAAESEKQAKLTQAKENAIKLIETVFEQSNKVEK